LRHGQDHSTDICERPLHPARLLEDAKGRDLGGEPLAVFRSVVRADAEKDDDTGFDFSHALVANIDRCGANPLHDRAR
jgi:hypothetical protein